MPFNENNFLLSFWVLNYSIVLFWTSVKLPRPSPRRWHWVWNDIGVFWVFRRGKGTFCTQMWQLPPSSGTRNLSSDWVTVKGLVPFQQHEVTWGFWRSPFIHMAEIVPKVGLLLGFMVDDKENPFIFRFPLFCRCWSCKICEFNFGTATLTFICVTTWLIPESQQIFNFCGYWESHSDIFPLEDCTSKNSVL